MLRVLQNEIWLQMQTLKKMCHKRPIDTYLCCICDKRQHECICESFRIHKTFFEKSVVNDWLFLKWSGQHHITNATIHIVHGACVKTAHVLDYGVVAVDIKNIMSKSLEPHLDDCFDIACRVCRCAECGRYKGQCTDPSHPKWNDEIFPKLQTKSYIVDEKEVCEDDD